MSGRIAKPSPGGLEITITNYGPRDLDGANITAVIFSDAGLSGRRFVVSSFTSFAAPASVAAGQSVTFQPAVPVRPGGGQRVALILTNGQGQQVQSALAG